MLSDTKSSIPSNVSLTLIRPSQDASKNSRS